MKIKFRLENLKLVPSLFDIIIYTIVKGGLYLKHCLFLKAPNPYYTLAAQLCEPGGWLKQNTGSPTLINWIPLSWNVSRSIHDFLN